MRVPPGSGEPDSGSTPSAAGEQFGSGSATAGRPELRYTPPFGWMNDPNGLSHVDGRWHMFFQYNPNSIDFGNIGWGHAVSDDLVKWTTWPTAIEPTADQLIFSGSLVTGAGDPPCPSDLAPELSATCMVAVYTTNRQRPDGPIQTQDLAVSTDAGATFTKFDGNPVIDLGSADFRDPKVFYDDELSRWVMVVVLPVERQVVLFGSPDLITWEELSRFGPIGSTEGIWECPDLFPAPILDDTAARVGERWIMKVDTNPGHPAGGSGAQWFVGTFDGVAFIPDDDQPLPRWVDHGRDFYCATTFHDGADELGRPLWLAWMNNWDYAGELPTFPWRGSMTLARRVWLRDAGGSLELVQEAIGVDVDRDPIATLDGPGDLSLPRGALAYRPRRGLRW